MLNDSLKGVIGHLWVFMKLIDDQDFLKIIIMHVFYKVVQKCCYNSCCTSKHLDRAGTLCVKLSLHLKWHGYLLDIYITYRRHQKASADGDQRGEACCWCWMTRHHNEGHLKGCHPGLWSWTNESQTAGRPSLSLR